MLKVVLLLALAAVAMSAPTDMLQDESVFCEDALEAHNLHRMQHGVAPLKLNSDLSAMAKLRATQLGMSETPSAQVNLYKDEFVGESVAVVGKFHTGKDITELWHASMAKYLEELEHGKFVKSRSFAQIVWNNTQEVGFAYVKSPRNGKYFIVAEYFPSGNVEGQYEQNVNFKHMDDMEETTTKKTIVVIVSDEPTITTTTEMMITTSDSEPIMIDEITTETPLIITSTLAPFTMSEEIITKPAKEVEEVTESAPKVVSVIKTIVKTINKTEIFPAVTTTESVEMTTMMPFTTTEMEKEEIVGRIVMESTTTPEMIVTEPIISTTELVTEEVTPILEVETVTTTTEKMPSILATTTSSNTMIKGKISMQDLIDQEEKERNSDKTIIVVNKNKGVVPEKTITKTITNITTIEKVMPTTTTVEPIIMTTEEELTTLEMTTEMPVEITTTEMPMTTMIEETTTTMEPTTVELTTTTTEMEMTTIEEPIVVSSTEESTTMVPVIIKVHPTMSSTVAVMEEEPTPVKIITSSEVKPIIEKETLVETTTLSKNKPLEIEVIPVKSEMTEKPVTAEPVIIKTGKFSLRDYLKTMEETPSTPTA